ncbi:MAG: hypothetical protein K6G67_01940 [Lachnospiraceae bacterium]|nr:hypothetical protein [Lachnospiraceae bacterium]
MKKYINPAVRIILFIVIFALIIHVMNFCLVVSNWASIDRWEAYASDDGYDTLFVGSSVGWVIVPRTIDAMNDCKCVNMSTPDQFYRTSADAVKFVSSQQPLQKVVLLTGFDALSQSEDYAAAASFLDAKYETAPLAKRYGAIISDKLGRYKDIDFLTSVESMNIWVDWVLRFSYTLPQVYKNIAYRRGRIDPGYVLDMEKKIERIDPPKADKSLLDEDIAKAGELGSAGINVDPDSLGMLDEMASFLSANGIGFTVIVTPHRSDVRAGYGEGYGVIDSYLKEFVEKRGGQYFNLDNDESLRERLPDDMFMDHEHIVDEGNNLVSGKIAELLR